MSERKEQYTTETSTDASGLHHEWQAPDNLPPGNYRLIDGKMCHVAPDYLPGAREVLSGTCVPEDAGEQEPDYLAMAVAKLKNAEWGDAQDARLATAYAAIYAARTLRDILAELRRPRQCGDDCRVEL